MFDADHPSIAIVGDTQETIFVERFFMGRESNLSDSKKLIQNLADQKLNAVLMLGDYVSYGSSEHDWKSFDQLISPLRSKNISLSGVLGNHEYWGGSESLPQAYARFPKLQTQHWYVEKYNGLGFVFLDSNRGRMGQERWKNQESWLNQSLLELQQDTSVKAVFLLAHHPPYSNSRVTSDSEASQEFAKKMNSYSKVLGLFSGHAHGYERFVKKNKHFIVSGGGGGPRVSYHTGKDQRHVDLYQGPSPRPFHFLLLQAKSDSIVISARGFQKGGPVQEFDRFAIPYQETP